jgi:membrane protein required for colicin V production
MTWVDLVVFGLLAISGLLAFARGLVREVLGIGAWAGAAGTAIIAVPMLRSTVSGWVPSPQWVDPASFMMVFLVMLVILMLVAGMIGNVVRGSALGGVDRTLGLLFGLARGAVVVVIAYILAGMVLPIERWPAAVLNARLLLITYDGARVARDYLPQDYRPRLYAPPGGRETTADDLLSATPLGRATGKPPVRE